jgi:hypothetical protein
MREVVTRKVEVLKVAGDDNDMCSSFKSSRRLPRYV